MISKLTSSDYCSIIICLIDVIITIITLVLNEVNALSLWIISIVSQMFVVFAWIYSIVIRYNAEDEIKKHKNEIVKLKSECDNVKRQYELEMKKLNDEREIMIKQLGVISLAFKCHNIHNNQILVKIPDNSEEQYDALETYQKISDGNKEEEIKKQTEYLRNKYISSLFDIFNSYCRDCTLEIQKIQDACLIINNNIRKISITIKLFCEPYYSLTDRSEDIKVYTAYRDNDVYVSETREIGCRIFSVVNNTDFSQCLTKDCFIKNNISKNDDSYLNEDTEFLKFYNCTVVVPIREQVQKGGKKIWGYLCCDCYNNDTSIEIFTKVNAQYLFGFAQNLATFLETLDNNLMDRFDKWDNKPKSILEILYNKIYKN